MVPENNISRRKTCFIPLRIAITKVFLYFFHFWIVLPRRCIHRLRIHEASFTRNWEVDKTKYHNNVSLNKIRIEIVTFRPCEIIYQINISLDKHQFVVLDCLRVFVEWIIIILRIKVNIKFNIQNTGVLHIIFVRNQYSKS